MVSSFLTVFLPILALLTGGIYAVVWQFLKKKREPEPVIRHLARWVFLTYAVCLLFLTVISSALTKAMSPGVVTMRRFNLIPFASVFEEYVLVRSEMIKQLFLNVGMFVPEGFLLSVLFPQMRKASRLLPTVLATTVGIELVQYFIGRSADVDDVLMNFLGGLIGFLLFLLCRRLFGRFGWWRKAIGEEQP